MFIIIVVVIRVFRFLDLHVGQLVSLQQFINIIYKIYQNSTPYGKTTQEGPTQTTQTTQSGDHLTM